MGFRASTAAVAPATSDNTPPCPVRNLRRATICENISSPELPTRKVHNGTPHNSLVQSKPEHGNAPRCVRACWSTATHVSHGRGRLPGIRALLSRRCNQVVYRRRQTSCLFNQQCQSLQLVE